MKPLTTDEFIQKAIAVHGNIYGYSKVRYTRAIDEVTITCSKHGDFLQLPYNHLRGNGCPVCNRIDGRVLGIDKFIERAYSVHGDLYDYFDVVYVNSKTPVKIRCSTHGVFEQTPNKHLSGQGCPLCASNCKLTTETFVKKAHEVHGDLYDYSKVNYVDEHTKVCIIDPVYGEFWQQPNSHLNGRGSYSRRASKCNDTKRHNGSFNKSACADNMFNVLCSKFGSDNVKREYTSECYPFRCDFYVVSFDLYVELNGHPTHGGHWFDANNADDLSKLQKLESKVDEHPMYRTWIHVWTQRDVLKRCTALENNLNYLVFWDIDLFDFYEWYDAFDENNPVLKNI